MMAEAHASLLLARIIFMANVGMVSIAENRGWIARHAMVAAIFVMELGQAGLLVI